MDEEEFTVPTEEEITSDEILNDDVADEEDVAPSVIVVEDGSGMVDSNSFVSVEYADGYLGIRNEGWKELSNAEKERKLILATDYINSVFNWKGKKASQLQALSFPRVELIDSDGFLVVGVPKEIKQATCDAVEISMSGKSLFREESEKGDVASESVGGAISVSYFQGTKRESVTLYETINSKLRGLYEDSSVRRIVSSRVTR